MRSNGKNTLQTFQKGILISIKSIKLLYEDLKQKYNIDYILTHRLNHDSLESFFSTIRSRGGLHDHLTPLNAMYRTKIIVLGKNPGVIQDKVNIEVKHNNTNVEEYLVANVLSTADIKVNSYENDDELSDSSLSCGWLARKFKNKYPHLGNYTKDNKPDIPIVHQVGCNICHMVV